MNAVLAEFLQLLGYLPGVFVEKPRQHDSTLVARVSYMARSASLVANSALPPVGRDRKGRRIYGAYTILDEGYGDWIKGDDAHECAAYVAAWILGRMNRQPRHDVPTVVDLTALTSIGQSASPSLDDIERELSQRSTLGVTGPGQLVSADGELAVHISLSGSLVKGATEDREFFVAAPSDGIRSAAILGFLDGNSEGSDE